MDLNILGLLIGLLSLLVGVPSLLLAVTAIKYQKVIQVLHNGNESDLKVTGGIRDIKNIEKINEKIYLYQLDFIYL